MTATRGFWAIGFVAAALCAVPLVADERPHHDLSQQATWKLPDVEQVRQQVFEWLTTTGAEDEAHATAEALWESAVAETGQQHLLDLVCATFALADPRARDLVDFCSRPREGIALADVSWLAEEETAPLVSDHLRLLFGRWLVQEYLYDEALEQLTNLQPENVADPAGLLFYQAAVRHQLLDRDEGLSVIARLLENAAAIPRRYASIARLMQADLDKLEDDSLDHIARRMDDIRRRLDLGRAGPKVREVEDGVIASLDKLIEEIEKQQQAAAAAAAAQQGGGRQQMPIQPLPDSRPMGGKGEGKVANKPIGDGSGWGDLPPRQREEALQQIGKEFPAHYRDMIEQYFRKLATDGENAER